MQLVLLYRIVSGMSTGLSEAHGSLFCVKKIIVSVVIQYITDDIDMFSDFNMCEINLLFP